MNATAKSDRTNEFYRDAFTTASTWTPAVFADACAAHGIVPIEDERFADTAERLWECLQDAERADFCSDLDDWLDA